MKMGWPLMKFFIYNYGEEIVMFIFEKLRENITKSKLQKAEEAIKKSREC